MLASVIGRVCKSRERSLPSLAGLGPNMNESQLDRAPSARQAKTAILLIAHGSRQEAANRDLHELVQRLEATAEYPIVQGCFLELADPDISTGGSLCVMRGANCVLLIPYLLSAGIHLERDLRAARDDLERRHPEVSFHLGAPLGPHPLLDQLVAVRIHELEESIARAK
jgi:sirohydrochlorin ferrochelatase